MTTETELSVAERISQLLQHLGIERAHFAACLPGDWKNLVAAHPDIVASLTLVCPWTMDPDALHPIASRLLVFTGDQGPSAEKIQQVVASLPGAALSTLCNYVSLAWSDMIAERTEEIRSSMMDFLLCMDRQQGNSAVTLTEGEGDIADISYSVRGAGPPLVLLPLALAPSQWEPILSELHAHYCTITLGGPALGAVVFLEDRGRSGYLNVFQRLIEETQLRPGESVLEVGCGSGVLARWLAQHTGGANRIVGVDINRYLLREATALARKNGLDSIIEFREGNAEALPFPENCFDVIMACTVLEEGNADRMLTELVRVMKPGGRVAVIVWSMDMPWWVNLPIQADLKAKLETPGRMTPGAAERGCADASLYQRLVRAGLAQVTPLPQLAVYADKVGLFRAEQVLTTLNPEEAKEWRKAMIQAEAEGTFFIVQPYHCAVGTKPLESSA